MLMILTTVVFLFSSRGSGSETVQQSCGLLVYRRHNIHPVSLPSYRHSWEPVSCVFPQTLTSSCVCLGWVATRHFTRRTKHAFSPKSWRQNMRSTRRTGTTSQSQVGQKRLFWWSVFTLFKHGPFIQHIFVNNSGFSWFLQRRTLSGTCWRRTRVNATRLNKRSVIHGENLRKRFKCGLKKWVMNKHKLTNWIMKKTQTCWAIEKCTNSQLNNKLTNSLPFNKHM